jgi:hypothetical protein
MSLEAKQYYCLCIEANRFRYSTYGREANRSLQTLLVPKVAPAWIDGAGARALAELCDDLTGLMAKAP